MTHPDIVQRLQAMARGEHDDLSIGDEAATEITTLRQQLADAREALGKIMPIRVHDGPDYAEVYFSDGSKHSTQAMTMNPQDWRDIQDLCEKLTPGGNHG
jgi:hypothetical protein